jgi:hypothetical protein
VSTQFAVRLCRCVQPGRLRARYRRGAWRLSVPAEYDRASPAGFRLLPVWVETGRALVQAFRDGERAGHIRLRYRRAGATLRRRVLVNNLDGRQLPVTTREPVDRGAFRATWRGPRGKRDQMVFKLVRIRDKYGNR